MNFTDEQIAYLIIGVWVVMGAITALSEVLAWLKTKNDRGGKPGRRARKQNER